MAEAQRADAALRRLPGAEWRVVHAVKAQLTLNY